MTLPRQKLREAVLQLLFSFDLGDKAQESLIPLLMQQLKASRRNIETAFLLAARIWEKKRELDLAISALSETFSLKRIHKTELQILRLGFYEILFDRETVPSKVAIAEAIRLARKFATPAAALFINALLDQQKKKVDGEVVDDEALQKAFILHDEQSDCEKNVGSLD